MKCISECFYDKELQACGSCYRTLEEIAEAGKQKKEDNETNRRDEEVYPGSHRRS